MAFAWVPFTSSNQSPLFLWCRLVANKVLNRKPPHPHSAGADQVEWGYALDVHCNAAFPLIVLLGG